MSDFNFLNFGSNTLEGESNPSGFSPVLSSPNTFGQPHAENSQPKPNGSCSCDVQLIISIPFPAGTELDAKKITTLTRAVNSELAQLGVEALSFNIDSMAMRFELNLPPYLTIDKLLRSIKNKAAYIWLVTQKEPIFFDGSSVFSSNTSQYHPDLSSII